MEEDIQKTALRLPKDLHRKVHEAATESGRSMNAEIVARLQESFQQQLPKGVLLSAAEAVKVAEKARKRVSAQIRTRVIENLNEDISKGKVSSTTEFTDLELGLMNPDEIYDLLGDLFSELKKAGYKLDQDGDEVTVMLPA